MPGKHFLLPLVTEALQEPHFLDLLWAFHAEELFPPAMTQHMPVGKHGILGPGPTLCVGLALQETNRIWLEKGAGF